MIDHAFEYSGETEAGGEKCNAILSFFFFFL